MEPYKGEYLTQHIFFAPPDGGAVGSRSVPDLGRSEVGGPEWIGSALQGTGGIDCAFPVRFQKDAAIVTAVGENRNPFDFSGVTLQELIFPEIQKVGQHPGLAVSNYYVPIFPFTACTPARQAPGPVEPESLLEKLLQ